MIDSYFDKVDASSGYKPKPSQPTWEDSRYFLGNLYSTMIDRNVAEAKFNLQGHISYCVALHKSKIRHGFSQVQAGSAV